jgi:hypothetical protein
MTDGLTLAPPAQGLLDTAMSASVAMTLDMVSLHRRSYALTIATIVLSLLQVPRA